MVLICVTAFLGGLLNALNRFAAPALAPTILNGVVIAAVWIGGKAFGLSSQAHLIFISWSVIIAGILQLATQVLWLRASGFSLNLNLNWSDATVRRVIITTAPMIVGMSAVQINSFTDSMIAWFLVPDGKGPAILGYAQYLYNLPLAIFGTALATAIFPMLAERAAAGDKVGFADTVERGLRATLFISIPAGVGLIAVSTPAVRVLFEHGSFDPADTLRVARSISFYSLGIWAYAMQHILVRAYYSRHDNRTPVHIATVMVLVNVVLNLALVGPLGESGVALGTALTSFVQVAALVVILRARLPELRWKGTVVTATRSALASVLMAAVIWTLGGGSPLGAVLPGGELTRLLVCIVAGTVVFFAVNALLGGREMRFLRRVRTQDAACVR
jgi:putative peptidoglycan lipid II flippase